jgi:hypothetical protein
MKQRDFKLAKSLSAAMLLMGSNMALAENVTVPATVTVNNAINFTLAGALDFGQVRASANATIGTCSGLTIAASASAAAATTATGTAFTTVCSATAGSSLQAVGGTPSRPVFTVAGVAPFTGLTLTLPIAAVDLTAATGPGTPQFKLIDFKAFKTSGTPGSVATTAGALTTDATGGAVFNVGATLVTESAGGTRLTNTVSITPKAFKLVLSLEAFL